MFESVRYSGLCEDFYEHLQHNIDKTKRFRGGGGGGGGKNSFQSTRPIHSLTEIRSADCSFSFIQRIGACKD